MGDEERAAFMRLAGDDGEIDAYELQDILNQEFKKRQLLVISLCNTVVEVDTVDKFKLRLDKFWRHQESKTLNMISLLN